MARGVNKVILIGNICFDLESRNTQSGLQVVNVRLATTEGVKSGDKWEDRTEYHAVVCWGSTATHLVQHASKGTMIYVEGRLQTRKYQSKDGSDRYKAEVVAQKVLILSGWNSDDKGGAKPAKPHDDDAVDLRGDDDLPFSGVGA